jgi:transcriptional regulator with GAF, ATPase, and Fis domain
VANPRLLAISGPLKDSTFVLSGNEVPVGRDSSNSLTISDPALSRRHCIITREGNAYRIRDLKSRNGTFVNGVAVKERLLQHGDQISIGDSSFSLLLTDDAEEPAIDRIEFEDRLTQATAKLRPQDVLYLQPDRILKELPSSSRLGRNLNALLKISRAVHSMRDLEQLQARILELIFEVTPAERGAILLDSKGKTEFGSVFARHRPCVPAKAIHVSRTVTQQVIEEGLAVLGADITGSGDLGGIDSLISSNVRSLLCVPMTGSGKVTGCIYLDTTSPVSRFDENHLQLAAAVASISGVALENAGRLHWLEQENLRLSTEISLEHNMVGEGARMREVYQFLARVAPKDTTVLIEGESGTGKELAARAIHRNSPRSVRPFVAINCAAIPEGLLESELFGHERGAFTDAVVQKKGRLEVANGGVVFLDEIGELAPALQVKLLRVLQEREFERVGGTRPISVDIRLITATNKNLEEAVKAGMFRLDLYYRLNVVTLIMPPLRERREDIPTLADYFVRKYSTKCKVKAKKISPDAMQCLVNYDWPGNVRELENAVERALVLNATDIIQAEDLPESILEKDPPLAIAAARYHATIKETKKQLILNALCESRGNYTEAAHLLGVHPNYLHRLIRNLDLKESIRSSLDSRAVSSKLSDAVT